MSYAIKEGLRKCHLTVEREKIQYEYEGGLVKGKTTMKPRGISLVEDGKMLKIDTAISPFYLMPLSEKKEELEQWLQIIELFIGQRLFREELHLLGDSFVERAKLSAHLIIDDYALPIEEKTIKPSNVGGVAGGEKYIDHGILFKLVEDPQLKKGRWLYGDTKPNHAFAAKSAGQELLNVNYIQSSKTAIKVPLMALIDYRGYRLVAIALLPINEQSLIYGSADGGKTFIASDETVSKLMDELGASFNLKKHRVGHCSMNRIMNMNVCGDIEVHECDFGDDVLHYYCLDAARLLPPVAPSRDNRQSIFYEYFRQEFLSKYPKSLSSDCFTGFQSADPLASQYNKDAYYATKHLLEKVLPAYVEELSKKETTDYIMRTTDIYYLVRRLNHEFFPKHLITHMHEHGINLRYLGRLYELLNGKESLIGIRNHILNVMIVRALKDYARRHMREKSNKLECKKLILTIMNDVCFQDSQFCTPKKFLTVVVPKLIKAKYHSTVPGNDSVDLLHRGYCLLEFCHLVGVVLQPSLLDEFTESYSSSMGFSFSLPNILNLRLTVKHSKIVDLASGLLYYQKSGEAGPHTRAGRDYTRKAHEKLQLVALTWKNDEHPIMPRSLKEILSEVSKQTRIDSASPKKTIRKLGMAKTKSRTTRIMHRKPRKTCMIRNRPVVRNVKPAGSAQSKVVSQRLEELKMITGFRTTFNSSENDGRCSTVANTYTKNVNVESFMGAHIIYNKAGHKISWHGQILGYKYTLPTATVKEYEIRVFTICTKLKKDKDCCHLLGDCYKYGRGTKKDIKQAIACYETAESLGDCTASFDLAMLYFKGVEIKKDLDKALTYCKKALKTARHRGKMAAERLHEQITAEQNK